MRSPGLQTFIAQGHTKLSLTAKHIIMKTQIKFLKKTLLLCLFIMTAACSENDADTPPVLPTDKIELTLTTSKTAYQNAVSGDWIQITETEYNLLATVLNSVSKIGTTDTQYNDISDIIPIGSGVDGITIANDNEITVQSGSYIFAYKYNVTEDNVSSTKVKVSETSVTENYKNIGSILPPHNFGDNYFVLKGSNSRTADTGHLGVFCLEKMGYKVISDSTNYYYTLKDTTGLDTKGRTQKAMILYQGLSTTEKQWD